MKKHIIITGKRNTGKSTLLGRLLENYDGPIYGFCSGPGTARRQGYRSYYIYPYGAPHIESDENHIGDSRMGEGFFNYDVFDNYALGLLDAKPDGIIVMDEIGFMEAGAGKFCARILELLGGDIPIIAVAKVGHDDVELLRILHTHPNAEIFNINEENRDAVLEEILGNKTYQAIIEGLKQE